MNLNACAKEAQVQSSFNVCKYPNKSACTQPTGLAEVSVSYSKDCPLVAL